MSDQHHPGSCWWKFDFHTHTPASMDYRGDQNISPEQWLRDYKNSGVQCVVVTDHNTGAWIDQLKTALAQFKQQAPEVWQGFTLFPGMEVSCNGGVHLIAILRTDKSSADMDALRGAVKYTDTPGDSNGVTALSVEQVIDAIHAVGGLACAAHIDQEKGLLTAITDHHTLEAVLSKLDALEVIDPEAACLKDRASLLEKEKRPWVLGSDSHQPKRIGRGFTWVKISTPSFDGLRLALLDPESAIRRGDQHPSNPQQCPEQWIESITLKNMHLRRNHGSALTLRFNPAYNAIIGGRGSGKSTILECLRLGLARENELENLGADSEIRNTFAKFRQEYVGRDKPGMMLPDTEISVEVVKGRAELRQRFKFVWSKRDDRFAPQMMRFDEHENAWKDTGMNEEDVRSAFPVKIFSQKQILALAQNPQALLEHIDNSIQEQKKNWQEQFDQRKSELRAARLRVRTLKKELAKKPALELEYRETSRKARVFANANFGLLLKAYQRATQQQRALDDFYALLTNDMAALREGIEQAAGLASTELTQFQAETQAEIEAHAQALWLKQQLLKQYESIVATATAMQAQLDATHAARALSPWQQENQAPIQAYQNEAARLKNEGINSAQDAAIAVAAEERLNKQLAQLKIFEAELASAESAVVLAAEALTQCRAELTQRREALIKNLLAQNDMLDIRLRSMASTKREVSRIREILNLGSGENFASAIWQEREESWLTHAEERVEEDGSRDVVGDVADQHVRTSRQLAERDLEDVGLGDQDGKRLFVIGRVD
ncbi:MAG: hypothetical protein V4623_05435, partial [Pseudomonadota bacterium]